MAGLPIVVLTSLEVGHRQRAALERFDQLRAHDAANIQMALSQYLKGKAEVLAVTAGTVAALPDADADVLTDVAEAQLEASGAIEGFYISDAAGRSIVFVPEIRADGTATRAGVDYSDRSYYREAFDTHEIVYSEMLRGRQTNVYTMVIGVPVIGPQDQFRGLVGAAVRLDNITQLVERVHGGDSVSRVQVLDSGGRALIDTDHRLSPLEATRGDLVNGCPASLATGLVLRDGQGTMVRGTCHRLTLGTQQWEVWLTTPEDVVVEVTGGGLWRTWAATCAALAFVLVLAVLLRRWVDGWLQSTHAIAKRVAAGDLSVDLPPAPAWAPSEWERMRLLVLETVGRLRTSNERSKLLLHDLQTINQRQAPLATAWDGVAEGLEVIDPKGQVQIVNPALAKLLGLPVEEIRGRPSTLLNSVGVPDDLLETLGAGTPWTGELRGVGPGRQSIHGVTANPVIGASGQVDRILVIRRDITAAVRRAAEDSHRERLASVGTLAAGLAHEINNPLTYINANIRMLQEHVDGAELLQPSEASTLAEEALEGLGRVGSIVSRMLLLARRGPDDHAIDAPTILEMSRIVESAVSMVRLETRGKVRISVDMEPIAVEAREADLIQLFINLLVNAIHAHRAAETVDPWIRVTGCYDNVMSVVDVQDNGPGVPDELRAKIFDPFFTTRGPGIGTGLGLSIGQRTAVAHGGKLQLVDTAQKGATFRLFIPNAEVVGKAEVVPSVPPQAPVPQPPDLSEPGVVLVVDDERIVARSIARSLRPAVVVVAHSVAEAVDLLDTGGGFSVVLSDVNMPGQSGMDLFDYVRTHHPDLVPRFLFFTGAPDDPHFGPQLRATGRPVLGKPLDSATLRETVREYASMAS